MAASMLGGPSEGITSTSHQDGGPAAPGINTGTSSAVQDEHQHQQPQRESAARRIFRNAAGVYRVNPPGESSSSAHPSIMGRPASATPSPFPMGGICLSSGHVATFGKGAETQFAQRVGALNKSSTASSASPAPSASASSSSSSSASSSSSTSACSCTSASSSSRVESPVTTPPTSAFSTTFPEGVREEDDCMLEIHGDDASRYTQDASGVLGLPKYLPRPENVRDFDMEALEFDQQLKGIPCHYILDNLAVQGPALLQAITQTTVIVPSESAPLPPLLVTKYLGGSADIAKADYVLAISAKDTKRTLLLPVHGLVMSTNAKCLSELSKCMYIPEDVLGQYSVLPESEKIQVKIEGEDEVKGASYRTLPVVSLSLPSAAAFSLLVPFFYTSSHASLLASLLPLRSMPYPQQHQHQEGAPPFQGLLNDTPNVLATRLSLLEQNLLLEHANLIHSVWQTAVALGAARDNLWKTLDIAWAVIVGALAIKEQRSRS